MLLLKAEIERREMVKLNKPKMLDYPDIESLRKMAQEYIDSLENQGEVDSDNDHWFFEAVMSAFYGNKVWGWINEQH